MKNGKLKIQILDDIDTFAISPDTMRQVSEGTMNYLDRIQIKFKKSTWHGLIEEAGEDAPNGRYLFVSSNYADQLDLDQRTTASITQSRSVPIVTVQMKKTSPKEQCLPLIAGIQPAKGDVIVDRGDYYTILSTDPLDGYINEETTFERIGESESKADDNSIISNPLKKAKVRKGGTGFSQLVAMDKPIEDVKKGLIHPLSRPDLVRKYLRKPLKGLLLHGPYGVAKTAFVKAIAEEVSIELIHIPVAFALPAVISMAYEKAAQSQEGAIIFLDELDSIAPRGSKGDPTTATIQECMDGFNSHPNIFTIAATNHLNEVAEGLLRPGRFDRIVNIHLPTETDRELLFKFFLSSVEVSKKIDYREVAKLSASFSGADIEAVCKEAGVEALDKHFISGKDQVISQEALVRQVKRFKPTGARLLGVTQPKYSFDVMYGSDAFKKELCRSLDLISGKVSSRYSSPSSATILLHGPSGTGKTMAAQCIAKYVGANFVYRPATSFKGSYVGETESNIRKLFNAGRTYQPIVIFIDEIDSIGKSRSSRNPHDASALNELLVQLDGVANNKGLIVVGATNMRSDLDPALLSRFGYDFEMPLPNTSDRVKILRGLLSDLPDTGIDYALISRQTKGWSQRNLAGLDGECRKKLDLGEISKVTTSVLESLIQKTQPDSSLQNLSRRAS